MNNTRHQQSRLLWMDSLKLLTIFLVCWGHAIIFDGIDHDYAYEIQPTLFIYSFHMPLFMTISGYFASGLVDRKFSVKTKFIRLILPTITLGLICLILDIKSLNFWYLKSLFACYVICGLLFRLMRWWGVILTILIGGFFIFPLLNITPFISSYKIDFMLPFFLMGMSVKKYLTLDMKLMIFSIIGFLICLIFWGTEDIWYAHMSKWINYKDFLLYKPLHFDFESLWHYFFRFLTGAFGSLTFISTFNALDRFEIMHVIFEKIGKYGIYTLEIYLMQSFIIEVNPLNLFFPIDSTFVYAYVYSMPYAIFTVFVCILLAKILEEFKYIDLLFFGKTK